MFLLSGRSEAQAREGEWSASAVIEASAEEILDSLTDPRRIADWSPVDFDAEGLAGGRLRAGSRERVRGSIAGYGTSFEVEVRRADRRGLELTACGPLSFDVAYSFSEADEGVIVDVVVRVRHRRGLTGELMRAAVAALLNAGALRSALRRIEGSLERDLEPALVAA